MASVNRYLRGDTKEVELDVHGHSVIGKGDFVVIMKANSMLKSTLEAETTADWYGYSAASIAGVTPYYFDPNFAGIAMKGSISGTTEKIPVATAGIFRYPLVATTGVTVGQLVLIATSAATVAYPQTVRSKKSSELTDEYFGIVGVCVKTQAGATNVDFNLISRFSGVTYSGIKTGD